MLSPTRWIVVFAAVVNAGWFIFEGAYAAVTGEYFRPSDSRIAATAGAWEKAVEMVGIDPQSSLMHFIFVVYGLAWLVLTVLYFIKIPFSRFLMLAAAIGASWYLPLGTALCLLQVVLLILPKSVAKA